MQTLCGSYCCGVTAPISTRRSLQIGKSINPAHVTKYRLQRKTVQPRALFGLGVPELAVIGVVAALVFGPSKLPELGKIAGKSVKSFQAAAKEFQQELKDEVETTSEKPTPGSTPGAVAADKPKQPKQEPPKDTSGSTQ